MGCSVDDLPAQEAFVRKCSLRFPLIADPTRSVGRAFGAVPEEPPDGLAVRSTVVVDRDGTVLKTYGKASARGHAEAVLNDLRGIFS